jgi:SusD/RagB-like outer membrane lipoprotein
MANPMNRTTRRWARLLPVLVLAVGLDGCDNLLDVETRGLLTDETVKRAKLVDASVAAALGEYHIAFNWVAHSGASATDEALFAHVWTPWNDYDERDLSETGCPHDACGFGYDWMQRARVTGMRSVDQLKNIPAPDTAIAHALSYAGYSTVLLADHLCEVPLNGGPPLAPAVVYDTAIGLFQEAVQRAGGNTRLTNLANVGIARSSLNKNDLNQAIEYASKVDGAFEAWVRFAESSAFDEWVNIYNLFHRTTVLEFNTALDPAEWLTKRDLRVPFEIDSTRPLFSPHPEARRGYKPFTPYSFEGWRPGNRDSIAGGRDIRFASGLEAQYIIAEASLYGGAGGWTPAQVHAFLDQRRAVGGLTPYAGTDAPSELQAELREQRKMDFYFAGYRMPDLIRYAKYYQVDLWPKGTMGGYGVDRNGQRPGPAPSWQYGTRACWPVAQTEVNTNPNF